MFGLTLHFRKKCENDEELNKALESLSLTPAISARPASPESDSGASLSSEDTVILDQEPFLALQGKLKRSGRTEDGLPVENVNDDYDYDLRLEDAFNNR